MNTAHDIDLKTEPQASAQPQSSRRAISAARVVRVETSIGASVSRYLLSGARMPNFRNLLAVIAVVLTLAGCMRSSAAPQSSFTLLDGSSRTTADLKGKVALINFWATSCSTCVAEMPMLVATYEKFRGRGYETIAVAMSYDLPAYVVNFAQTRKLPFPVAIDNTGALAKAWGEVKLTPTTFLVNKRGEIVKRFLGKPDFVELHQLIDRLLSES